MSKGQVQKEQETDSQGSSSLELIKGEFSSEREKKTMRRVTLVTQSCCGCGCSDIKVARMVPFDSNLQDGDRVESMDENDEWL